MGFGDRLAHAWNAFMGRDPTPTKVFSYGYSSSSRPDRLFLTRGNERTIITSIYTRIANDVAAITIEHAQTDQNGRYKTSIDSGLNKCLTLSANTDQTGRAFIRDAVMTMLDEGCIAIVPVETDVNPTKTSSYDIRQLRVGKITQWHPQYVRIKLYNETTGRYEEVDMPKTLVAIVENPFYAIMNEPNSTMQRLVRKMALLDMVDSQTGSGKLDMIIQLPYVIKSEARRKQAEERRTDIENQLANSKLGIAYTDGTEKIVQLNRSLENNLLSQIEYLTKTLYSQLGMPEAVFDGTADEQTMLNYYSRTIEPILDALTDEMKRKFLTQKARTIGHSVTYFRNPFKLVPVNQMADIADKFTRNEILSSNEVRQIIGYKPVEDERADELRNKNLNQQEGVEPAVVDGTEEEIQNVY